MDRPGHMEAKLGRAPKHARRSRGARSATRRVAWFASILSVLVGLGIGANIGWFFWRSSTTGGALIRKERQVIAAATSGGTCRSVTVAAGGQGGGSESDGSRTPIGLLEVPSIGLNAPVVQGVSPSQLDVAVGHVPTSAYPGAEGTTVLSAHDVTWFSQINHLEPGDAVDFIEPCETLRYQVVGATVVRVGSPLYSTSVPMIAMVTCYPLDALFLTPKRYVVSAELVGVTKTGSQRLPSIATPAAPPLVVPAPPALALQGLSLTNNDAPLGTLGFDPAPPASLLESPVPLDIESSVLELYFAAIRASEQDHPGWWSDLAHGVAFSDAAPLVRAVITYNNALVTPTLAFHGSRFVSATLTAEPQLSGGARPGLYRVSMTAVVEGHELRVGTWSMTLLASSQAPSTTTTSTPSSTILPPLTTLPPTTTTTTTTTARPVTTTTAPSTTTVPSTITAPTTPTTVPSG